MSKQNNEQRLECRIISFYETFIQSNELGELSQMLKDFSEQSREYVFDEEYKEEEYETTRINVDKKYKYFLKKDNKNGIVLKIEEGMFNDQYGICVPSGLPKIKIELLDSGLRSLYDHLVSFCNKIEVK